MSNIIDSIQLSGVTYDLAGSGGVSESAFTAYTAATDTVLANKADLSAATITSTSETSTTGTYFSYKMLSFEYDDGAYLFSATTENDYPFELFSVTLKDAPNGNTVNIYLNTSTGETDSYILTESEYQSGSRTYATRTVTTKGNYRITYAYISIDGGGFFYDYGYKTRTVSSKAVSTYIEEDINPTLSGKVDSSTYTVYTAATDTALAGKQTTLTAGTGINITDNVISATGGGGGNPTIELTQAQYDALVTAGTVQADTYYIITDAQAGDLTNYMTSAQTMSAITEATSGLQVTLTAGTGIDITDNVISATGGGGGKAIEAGRGITVTTGETADTVSINLPISASTGTKSIIENSNGNVAGYMSHAEGSNTIANGGYSHAEGSGTIASGQCSHAEGSGTIAGGIYSHAEGQSTIALNESEHASGQYNVSNTGETDADKTLFSVGNGDYTMSHNAFEIRLNGDIYLTKDGQDIKLQDNLGGGGGGGKAVSGGTNISITTGTTADTINCTLPITAGTHSTNKGIIVGDNECSASGEYSISIGHNSDAGGNYSFCNGSNSSANGQMSFAYGSGCDANHDNTFMIGNNNKSTKNLQFSFGSNVKPKNSLEFGFGTYNNSVSASTTFGDGGNTLFSIGNGYDFSSTHNWHNAFEVRQNGDIYIANTNDTSVTGDTAYSLYPMIKLQDHLGGGSITVDDMLSSTSTNPVQNKVVKSATDRICNLFGYGTSGQTDMLAWATGATSNVIDNYVQFSKINGKKIIGGRLSPTEDFSLVETSAITTSVTSSSTDAEIPSAKCVYDTLGGLKLVKLTQSAYDALSPNYDSNTLYVIVN